IINRCIHAAVFVFTPCLCLLLYARLSYIEDSPLQRHFAFHPVDWSFFRERSSEFCHWFIAPQTHIPLNEKMLLFGAGAAYCLIRLFFKRRANKIDGDNPKGGSFTQIFRLGALFICLYVFCLMIAASFYDAGLLPKENFKNLERYLTPAHIFFLMMLSGVISDFLHKNPTPLKSDIGKIIITYFFLFYMVGSARCLMRQYDFGDEYANNSCRFSYCIWKIKTMPERRPIYSNNFPAIYIWGGEISRVIPVVKNPFSLIKNDKYLSQLFQMQKDIHSHKGVLVYFKKQTIMGKFTESLNDLQKKVPLHLIAQDDYASIFDVP
ncbi:MAG: hypothetical protein HQL14_06820, partial [Candidatus Omnitrophica bacterium]|nr:hypothetical protein [Candidatus Omnitrophota bacterium]